MCRKNTQYLSSTLKSASFLVWQKKAEMLLSSKAKSKSSLPVITQNIQIQWKIAHACDLKKKKNKKKQKKTKIRNPNWNGKLKKRERGEDPVEDGANDVVLKRPNPLASKRTKTVLVLLRERNFMGFIYAMKFLSNWERNLGVRISLWLRERESEREKFHGVYAKTVGFVGA